MKIIRLGGRKRHIRVRNEQTSHIISRASGPEKLPVEKPETEKYSGTRGTTDANNRRISPCSRVTTRRQATGTTVDTTITIYNII